MAIVFDCPHCKTNYRLKDEFAGKTATCKNPNCRKVIPIPKPVAVAASSKKLDVDAVAAAAFSDEPVAQEESGPGEMIQVTCIGCDHMWQVESEKEGKNVLCPECRKANRVPERKKAEKADWRGGPNKPSLAKVETGLDRDGAWTSANVGGISTKTAQEIMKERDAVEEPEVRRKKLIKRGSIGLLLMLGLGVGIYFLVKGRKASNQEANMSEAVKAIKGEGGTNDPAYLALIYRASGEYQIRSSKNADETKEALTSLQLARNTAKRVKGQDLNGAMRDVAVTLVELLGTTEQLENSERLSTKEVVSEIRQAIQAIPDPEAMADAVRAVTRKCAEKNQSAMAETIAHNSPNPKEMLGQVGLELLRIDRDKYRGDAEKIATGAPTATEPSMQALRIVLGVTPKKNDSKDPPPAVAWVAGAEALALKGEFANIRSAVSRAKVEDRIRALAAAGHAAVEKNPADATPLVEEAAKLLTTEGKGNPLVSPWVGVRVCRLLGQLGKFELGEAVAKSLPDDKTQAWGQLEVFRGRLASSKDKKAEDAWLDAVGDPAKLAAAVKAYEEIARHNTRVGENYSAIIKTWDKGKVQPFGTAGVVLGDLDRK